MADWNFNVTFPIFDRLFGTHWERARRAPAPAREIVQ
jgi:sterol desaturase/sphingolipid hydroxylase (fatty acid hydroxylase superfamily)